MPSAVTPMPGGGRGFLWSLLALAVLLWPANIPGLFDGAPLDGGVEAVVLGLLVPILCWFYGGFWRGRLGPALILALGLLRVADASFTEGGWCVRFEPTRPLVRDATGRPHSWDRGGRFSLGDALPRGHESGRCFVAAGRRLTGAGARLADRPF